MKQYFEKLKACLAEKPPNFGTSSSVLALLYETYSEINNLDNADFQELYQVMNGMELREMDQIIYPVCTLCRGHERTGFVEGVKDWDSSI